MIRMRSASRRLAPCGRCTLRAVLALLALLALLAVLALHRAEAALGGTIRVAACQAQPRVIDYRLQPQEVLAAVDQNLAALEAVNATTC